MKTTAKIFLTAAAVLALLQTALAAPDKAAPQKISSANPAAPKPAPVRSVFLIPANNKEGRDPFFPESPRLFEATASTTNRSVIDANTLVCKGVLGTPGQFVAIINNHAFAVGDESEVKTAGGHAHIRCVDIRNNLVTVEINGQRRELNIKAR
ncbi:MAG: hypothetical protein WCH99_01360 [Verrucomicrobiota bacterium]